MDILFIFLLLFIVCEIFEISWQKSNSLYELLNLNFYYYTKNIFIYFFMHISFIFALFVAIYNNNYDFWMSSILVVKFIDISFKLFIMKKLASGYSMSEIIPMNITLSPVMRSIGLIIYPLSYFFSILN